MIDRLLNAQVHSQGKAPGIPFPQSSSEKVEDNKLLVGVDGENTTNEGGIYAWNFESTDLGKLVIILRIADGVQYTIKKIDEHNVEITADGALSPQELEALAKGLHIPEQMLKFRSQPWKQKIILHTDNQISGGPSVAAVIGSLKVVTFPILAIKEDAILVL